MITDHVEHAYDSRVGEQKRYAGGVIRRLDRVTPGQWHELTIAVMERVERVSALPDSSERTASLHDLRPLLERLSRG